MKKIAIFSVLGVLFGASVAIGAVKVQEIKSWDYIAQIQTTNKGNLFLYEVPREKVTCYVLVGDDSKYSPEPQLSCVENVVKK